MIARKFIKKRSIEVNFPSIVLSEKQTTWKFLSIESLWGILHSNWSILSREKKRILTQLPRERSQTVVKVQKNHVSPMTRSILHGQLHYAQLRLLLFTVPLFLFPPSRLSRSKQRKRTKEIGIFAVTPACNSISFFLPPYEAERKSRKRGTWNEMKSSRVTFFLFLLRFYYLVIAKTSERVVKFFFNVVNTSYN